MALDKQRILSELGSVLNQLQSVDCGCMSKLFNNGAQASHGGMNGSQPSGCMHSCCGGGQRSYAPCAGEPHPRMPCGGCCNPPKLYSDTYSYLANNVMQPTIKEVYNDLKSLNTNNTIMNDNLPTQNKSGQQNMAMGPGSAGNAYPGQMMANMNNNQQSMGSALPHPSSMGNAMTNNNLDATMMNKIPMQNANQGGMMGLGMGPQIANMMGGGRGKPQGNGNEVNQQSELMKANASQMQHEQANANQFNSNNKNGLYNESNLGNSNMGQNMQNPLVQYSKQMGGTPIRNANAPGDNSMHNDIIGGDPILTCNPNYLQQNDMTFRNTCCNPKMTRPNHGMHSAGINKFNEIFPSAMQGDLGFDPMAIAVQMNPANKQNAAMETIKSLIMDDRDPRNRMAQQAIPQNPFTQNNTMQQQNVLPAPTQRQNLQINQMPNQVGMQNQLQGNQPQQVYAINNMQQFPTGGGGGIQQQQPQSLQQQRTNQIPMPNELQTNQPQQVYPMNTNQQQQLLQQQLLQQQLLQQQLLQQQLLQQQLLQQQQLDQELQGQQHLKQPQQPLQQQQIDLTQSGQPEQYDTSAPVKSPQQLKGNYLEPILPSDNLRNIQCAGTGYNTLGQPVQYVPPLMYRRPDPKLPQTLSPHESLRIAGKKYSNVKLTESKTSIVGSSPDGRTPSRNTLQNMYNQYKGSHSYTQQNVSNVVRGGTASDGKIKVVQESGYAQQPHVERIGGDTILNSPQNVGDAANYQAKLPNNGEQIGDIDVKEEPGKPSQDQSGLPKPYSLNIRNGIQDMVYTTVNAQAPSWTFHGEHQKRYSRPRARARKYRYY